jgi:thioredoxin 1
VLEISGAEFSNQVLAQPSSPVLVDFYATWCGPCKRLAPSVEQVASEFGSQLKVVRVDVDANPEVTRRYNVHAFPTLILFKNGRELNRTMGVVPIEAIRDNVQRLL